MEKKRTHDNISFKEAVKLIRADVSDRVMLFKEMIVDYGKFILPIILCVLVFVTFAIALRTRNRFQNVTQVVDETISETIKTVLEVTDAPFEVDAHPQVNQLIYDYYEALETGDLETLTLIQSSVTGPEGIRLGVMAKYIDRYDDITVYTKQGPYENSYIVYVYSEVYLLGRTEATPGLQAFYVCGEDNGAYYINTNQLNAAEADYIRQVSSQGDVIDLKNTVNVSYNSLMTDNVELFNYWANLSVEIDTAVGEQITLDKELQDQLVSSQNPDEGNDGTQQEPSAETVTTNRTIKVRTTSTVYVRKSASITADKLGTANAGTSYVLIENMINGWSKIKYEKTEGYIKTEYLEKIENINDLTVVGSVTATTGLNVRSEPRQTASKLGVLSKGDTVDLIVVTDGWCKINYKGEVGYVKADYVIVN